MAIPIPALDADLVAAAVVAAATAYGDDPRAVVAAPRCSIIRRALSAAASGLLEATGLPLATICRPLGVLPTTVSAARGRRMGDFAAASDAAEAAVLGLLKVRGQANAVRVAPPRAPARPVDAEVVGLVAPQPEAGLEPERGGALAAPPEGFARLTVTGVPAVPLPGAAEPRRPAPQARRVQDQAATDLPVVRQRMAAPSVTTPMARLPDAAPVIQPSPRSGARTAGKPADPARVRRTRTPPADLPRRDEDRRAENAEIRLVHDLRAKNTPWPHVARQIGKSIPDTRRRYDPEYRDA